MSDSYDKLKNAREQLVGPSTERLVEVLLNKNQHFSRREAALESLVESQDPSAVKAINAIIQAEDKHIALRLAAITSVGNLKHTSAVSSLVQALQDGSSRIRRRVVTALEDVGDLRAVEPLIGYLLSADESDSFKQNVISALSRIGGDRVFETLTRLVTEENADVAVRVSAIWGLNQIAVSGEGKRREVIELMQHLAGGGYANPTVSSMDRLIIRPKAVEVLAGLAHLAVESPHIAVASGTGGSFILSSVMHDPGTDAMALFHRYAEYLESIRNLLPQGAKSYAFGPHNCGGPECPHDSWLESLRVESVAPWNRIYEYS